MSDEQPSRFVEVLRFIRDSGKRIAVTVVGGIVVAAGLAMLVLPGPGILVVAIGFAILGTEYAWAARALDRTKEAAEKAGEVAKDAAKKAGSATVSGAKTAGRKLGDAASATKDKLTPSSGDD